MDNSKNDKNVNEIESLVDRDSKKSASVDMNSSAKSEQCSSNILNSSVVTCEPGYIEPTKNHTYTTIPSSMSNDFLPLLSIQCIQYIGFMVLEIVNSMITLN